MKAISRAAKREKLPFPSKPHTRLRPGAMEGPNDEQRRALQLLVDSPKGCTEEAMLAAGFELATLGDLMFGGFAVATARDTLSGSQWIEITDAGRKAIAE
jgi:hypothetical protein